VSERCSSGRFWSSSPPRLCRKRSTGRACDPATGCEPAPDEKEKKPSPLRPVTHINTNPCANGGTAFRNAAVAPTPVKLEGGENFPTRPSKAGDVLPLWLVPVILIGVAITGGFWWYRRGKGRRGR